ncbi:hypothetical protein TcarDRAFT_1577 [Thermosinus carboxydivorans Nor1]|uniref:Uncharacterized protein n=1 Tax=Thermosinus carboxydivorans Nor1 TaxID=401526 RepID=A1HQ39_9FIRM|nr:hypothetical protein [Thermosinus carboxydivorans]EAX47888.1 hypothetical protein TcarDRAFT_1577 [Thermosinus carboxydivorans Nor1]
MGKVFVQITAEHNVNGEIRPLSLRWTNGRIYPIDRILDVRPAASLKGGGQGMRYTCRIAGKEVYLFCDEGRWFIER